MRGRSPPKAFPLGGRWHGEAVTDEGAMIERFFVGPDALIGLLDGSFRRVVSPPAGGDLLCPWRQSRQNAPGGRLRMSAPRSYSPYPRTPFTGVTPWTLCGPSGAQNQECLGAVPSGPTGGLCEEKLELVRFYFCAWRCRTNAPGANPGRAGLGPAPTRRMGPSLYLRRGGYQPPATECSASPVGAAHWAARPSLPLGADAPCQGADSPCQGEMAVGQKG